MTYRELLNNLDALGIGFDSDVTDALDSAETRHPRLCAIINRGIADLNRIRPKRAFAKVDLKLMDEETSIVNVKTQVGLDKYDRIDPRSIYGNDRFYYGLVVIDGNNIRVDRAYMITQNSCPMIYTYAEPFTPPIDIEDGKTVTYKNGGTGFVSNPERTFANGKTIYFVTETVSGVEHRYLVDPHIYITVSYLVKPTPVTIDTDELAEIELDEGLCDLLPYFVASFLYMGEDDNLASYYRRLYDTRRAEIVQREYQPYNDNNFHSTNGW